MFDLLVQTRRALTWARQQGGPVLHDQLTSALTLLDSALSLEGDAYSATAIREAIAFAQSSLAPFSTDAGFRR
jgi:hypothetical protein